MNRHSLLPSLTLLIHVNQSVERGKFRLDGKTYKNMLELVQAYSNVMRFPVLAPRLSIACVFAPSQSLAM